MELWYHGRCVARVPAPTFDRSLALAYGPAATAIGQNLKFPGVQNLATGLGRKMAHENLAQDVITSDFDCIRLRGAFYGQDLYKE
jgi:hypothetical protein